MSEITVHLGDSRDVLKTLADNSIDSVVTDPPYALVSIGKRFGADDAAPAKPGKSGAYARASAGFMGKKWDTGETAFAVEFWAEVMRVLKPGGHVIAFSGTRTYHRLAVAIEDAGFEIRDMVAWLYGSGFPKSHDVSKGIDKMTGRSMAWFGPWLRTERKRRGITQKALAVHFPSKTGGLTGCVANWELGLNLPTEAQFTTLCAVLGLSFEWIDDLEREVVGTASVGRLAVAPGQGSDRSATDIDLTVPRTDAARQWQGWGTALKPALEPIVLARKPLESTVAGNVVKWGTGALNIDASRIASSDADKAEMDAKASRNPSGKTAENVPFVAGVCQPANAKGRWPANVCHDGSEEVVGALPESLGNSNKQLLAREPTNEVYGKFAERGDGGMGRGDSGSASRFFYTAKADATERLGSKHPTVKPTDLMAYLIRLVTPPGGTTLDPFAGSGSTGVAAVFSGFNAVLIEREPEYHADILRRIAWAKGEGGLTMTQKRIPAATKNTDGDLFS